MDNEKLASLKRAIDIACKANYLGDMKNTTAEHYDDGMTVIFNANTGARLIMLPTEDYDKIQNSELQDVGGE